MVIVFELWTPRLWGACVEVLPVHWSCSHTSSCVCQHSGVWHRTDHHSDSENLKKERERVKRGAIFFSMHALATYHSGVVNYYDHTC